MTFGLRSLMIMIIISDLVNFIRMYLQLGECDA